MENPGVLDKCAFEGKIGYIESYLYPKNETGTQSTPLKRIFLLLEFFCLEMHCAFCIKAFMVFTLKIISLIAVMDKSVFRSETYAVHLNRVPEKLSHPCSRNLILNFRQIFNLRCMLVSSLNCFFFWKNSPQRKQTPEVIC